VLGRKRRTDLLPDGDAWLLVEFGGDSSEEANEQAEQFVDAVRRGAAGPSLDSKLYEKNDPIAQVWEIREGGVGHSPERGSHSVVDAWRVVTRARSRTSRRAPPARHR
jgi:hypothetical protein